MGTQGLEGRSIRDLLDISIRWVKDVGRPQWVSTCFGGKCELLMNDFPDEHLYTLKWRGEQLDFDDTPVGWLLPTD